MRTYTRDSFSYDPRGDHSYRANYPVLYLLDPDVEFGLVENIARTMINYDAMEPFIIGLKIVQRIKFLCTYPLEKKDFESRDHEYKGLSDCTGGSRKFKNFIEKELYLVIRKEDYL